MQPFDIIVFQTLRKGLIDIICGKLLFAGDDGLVCHPFDKNIRNTKGNKSFISMTHPVAIEE